MKLLKSLVNFRQNIQFLPIVLILFFIPIFWNPFFIYSFTQGKEILFKIILLLTALIFLIFLFFKRTYRLKNIFSSILFCLLTIEICVFALTNLLSPTSTITIYGSYSRGFGFIIELFLFIFLIYSSLVLSEKSIIKLLKVFLLSNALVAIYAVLQKIGINPFFHNYDIDIFNGRVFSFLGNPSYLGQLMLLDILLAAYFFFIEKYVKSKVFYAAAIILFFIVLILSGTRTAFLGLIVAVIILAIKYYKSLFQIIKNKKAAFLVSTILLSIIFISLPNDRFSFTNSALRSLNSRFEIWRGTIDLIKERPIFGYGKETFYIYFPEIVTKKFLTLEENLNISADRVHNESLEVFFSHGFFGFLIYLIIILYILKKFFKSKNALISLLTLIVIINTIQNQLSFSDITISIFIAFCYGSLVALESPDTILKLQKTKAYIFSPILLFLIIYVFIYTVYYPYKSQIAYAESKTNLATSYDIVINKHKEAIYNSPYYSELWYDLMLMDPSSMERSLFNLEKIEGNSGNVLAWKGNFYSKKDPDKASDFYIRALEKNPYNPNWIRAFADMLYANGDFVDCLYFYNKYLEAVPDFWKWTDNLSDRSLSEQKSYRIFFKNSPDFWKVIDRINDITDKLEEEK